jgi:hypothetical protein
MQSPIVGRRTFIFSYVLERKREARVFALDDAHLAECALADNSQQSEVVEVYWVGVLVMLRTLLLHMAGSRGRCGRVADAPWSVKTTGLPLL